MIRSKLKIGKQILPRLLNSLAEYVLITMEEPWNILKRALTNKPQEIIVNRDMQIEHLKLIEERRKSLVKYLVGVGGGTACDTAKYLSWKWGIPLIISPSIISVDAWLCRSIAVRVDHRVRYIGNVEAEQYVVDYSLLQRAPKSLNKAGVADIISISSALGDWLFARDVFHENFDQKIFDAAKKIVTNLLIHTDDIRKVNNQGIDALIQGQMEEVALCELWGNARPEEGSEHHLAYCLENITHSHYIHGNLIALNVLIVLKLQKEKAVFDYNEIQRFFDRIDVEYSPRKQRIAREDFKRCLNSIQKFTEEEQLLRGLWSQKPIFDASGEYSLEGILDWIYSFR